jgi:hypothetical protein
MKQMTSSNCWEGWIPVWREKVSVHSFSQHSADERIKNTTERVDKLMVESSTKCLWITICLLIVILVVVVALAIET